LASTYTTHNVLLESADFNILVIEFPKEDVVDRLAVLASEKGLIYKHLYEDFVLTTCLANSGPFLLHKRRSPPHLKMFSEISIYGVYFVINFKPGVCSREHHYQ
jgi:hypothetical protein